MFVYKVVNILVYIIYFVYLCYIIKKSINLNYKKMNNLTQNEKDYIIKLIEEKMDRVLINDKKLKLVHQAKNNILIDKIKSLK